MIPLRVVGRTDYRPYVTFFLLVTNCFVFLLELIFFARGEEMSLFYQLGFNPCSVGAAPLPDVMLSLFSSMFLHASVLHLGGNMLYLWLFGGRVEQYFGRRNFLIFYLVSGIGATAAHHLTNSAICIPAIGASGAISGVLGAFILLHPGVKVETMVVFFRVFFVRFDISSFYFIGFWFVMQLVATVLLATTSNVAFWAHIGGFVTGLLITFSATMFRPTPRGDAFSYLDE